MIKSVNPIDIQKLVVAIKRLHPSVKPGTDFIWTASAPLKVIDCVLSLNRKYDTVVLPRVLAFDKRFPEIRTCDELRRLIDSFPSSADFVATTLNYRDVRRSLTLSGVLDFVLRIQHRYSGGSEEERLHEWATRVRPADLKLVGVKGFGLAGFQYLRMLFGAETTKPDVHIIAYVSGVVGRKLNDVEALEFLEVAAAEAGVPLRWLDVAIWESRARADMKA